MPDYSTYSTDDFIKMLTSNLKIYMTLLHNSQEDEEKRLRRDMIHQIQTELNSRQDNQDNVKKEI